MKYLKILIITLLFASCKREWLDVKPVQSLVVPNKIQDFQALLDNTSLMNLGQSGILAETSSDDLLLSYTSYLSCAPVYRNAYIWSGADDFYEGTDFEWRNSYQRILCANLALEGISQIPRTALNATAWDTVKGGALFHRAYDLYNLAQQYCKPFTQSSANGDLGIPLRLNSDINKPSKRSTVKETYDRIISDLVDASGLLPKISRFKSQPSSAATLALLARVYLSMGDYPSALKNADECLQINSALIDYSELIASSSNPIPLFNDEVIYHSVLGNAKQFFLSNFDVVPELIEQYDPHDLRLKIFFQPVAGRTIFKGSYSGSSILFAGLAVDEILLIRAECYARTGKVTQALKDLNDLLKKRWPKSPEYIDFQTNDKNVALEKILTERRKELCFRALRWIDLRRLNQEEDQKATLNRVLNGKTYRLTPESPNYIFPIDRNEIRISNIEQNSRN